MKKSGRETFLVKLDWADDWPIFNNGKEITIQTEGRPVLPHQKTPPPPNSWKADLSKHSLELGWYQKRKHPVDFHLLQMHVCTVCSSFEAPDTPLKQEWSLCARPGWLRLYGSCYDLTSPEAPTLLLRKQSAFKQTFRTVLDFRPGKEGYEAGVVVWWSMFSFASIGVHMISVDSEGGKGKLAVIWKLPTETIDIIMVRIICVILIPFQFIVSFSAFYLCMYTKILHIYVYI